MTIRPCLVAVLALATLSACESGVEKHAGASTAAAGTAPAALGLTETQLLEADLVAADGTELGDVEQVRRSASGTVESLLVEIENSDPDRYVLVPLKGLRTRVDGDYTDLETTMTAANLTAMPDATQPR